jgi:hypothetical protein
VTKSYTPRLGLLKESDDEYIDQFDFNWPLIDQYAGGLVVADGVTPPDNQLFDGTLVIENTSGKQWLAKKNPVTGLFSKQWLLYPWQCAAYNPAVVINTSGGTNQIANMSTFNAGHSVNSSAADISTGSIVLPANLPGIYSIQAYATFTNNGTGGLRSLFIDVDNINDYPSSNMLEDGQLSTYTTVLSTLIQNCNGNTISAKVWQSSGGLVTIAVGMMATLITPV